MNKQFLKTNMLSRGIKYGKTVNKSKRIINIKLMKDILLMGEEENAVREETFRRIQSYC